MARRPFMRRKSNKRRNKEAIDVFNLHNTLHPGTRGHYVNVVNQFGDFLILHKKSLWDATPVDAQNFLNQLNNDSNVKSIIHTFYRVLIEADEYERENPIVLLRKKEAAERKKKKSQIKEVSEAERVIAGLDEEESKKIEKQDKILQKKRRKLPKPIMTVNDLEELLAKTRHIRERAILELLFATGARLKELINLNVSDIDLEGKKVLFFESNTQISRAIALPKRTLAFLKVYERWRFRQLSPSNAYFISKRTKERISSSTVSTWLYRLQRGKNPELRWTANDFRKRSILHHYWLTKDLAAVTRFAGFKRPEATLRIINQVLVDRGIESIEELGKLPEFEELEKDKRRISPTIESSTSITINLDPDELEMLRRSGLTPTQAVRTIFSLKDLYGAVAPGAVAVSPGAVASPVAKPKSGSGGPGGGPSGGPGGGGPGAIKPFTPSAGGPNLSGGGAPNLAGGTPNLSGGGTPNLAGGGTAKPSTPKPVAKPPPMRPPPMRPSSPGGGGSANFLGELKKKLAARRAAAAEGGGESVGPKDHFSNVKIVDSSSGEDSSGPNLGGGSGPNLGGGSPNLGSGSSGPSLGGSSGPNLGGSSGPSLGGGGSPSGGPGGSSGPSLGGESSGPSLGSKKPSGGPSLGSKKKEDD